MLQVAHFTTKLKGTKDDIAFPFSYLPCQIEPSIQNNLKSKWCKFHFSFEQWELFASIRMVLICLTYLSVSAIMESHMELWNWQIKTDFIVKF